MEKPTEEEILKAKLELAAKMQNADAFFLLTKTENGIENHSFGFDSMQLLGALDYAHEATKLGVITRKAQADSQAFAEEMAKLGKQEKPTDVAVN